MSLLADLIASYGVPVALSVAVSSIATWIVGFYAEQRIKHHFDNRVASLKEEREIRVRAEIVADLLSKWGGGEADYKELNKLSYQACLWLPSSIVEDISKLLTHTHGSATAPQIVVKVRNHLLQGDDPIDPSAVVFFSPPENAPPIDISTNTAK